MAFVSTSDPQGRRYSLADALRLGPAPDGGLFLPEKIAPLPATFRAGLAGRSHLDVASEVLAGLFGDELSREAIEKLVAAALDFDLPLVRLEENLRVLELFHGPTLAFKDVGARFLARLLPLCCQDEGELTILVATSGDTGGAVAQAFWGVDGTRVAVLYPRGKVSPRQERQFTTLGGNVRAFAVDGVFDDCQRLVKRAFADRPLAQKLGLTSANSINVGRLLPQAIYYWTAAADLSREEPSRDRPLLFATPSGNFGNLCAGLLARRQGLPARFLAATNANDVVPEYLAGNDYRPRPSQATLSNAMDVGDPNNFVRILSLYGGDREALRRDVEGARISDEETLATLLRYDREKGYLADPHTAVGLLALERALARTVGRDIRGSTRVCLSAASYEGRPQDVPGPPFGTELATYPEGTIGIVLATAHPAKFAEAVEPALGRRLPLPEALAKNLESPVLAEELPNEYRALEEKLASWR